MTQTFRRSGRRSNTRRTFYGATRAAWMGARAWNALRRPVFIGAVSVGAFATALVAFVVMPQQAEREARLAAAGLDQTIDTMPYLNAVRTAQARLRVADSTLQAARALLVAQSRPTVADSVAPAPAADAERNALAERVVALNRLIDRAENAPLPISYRALAESPELRDDARVRALVDTLTEVERERESFGAVGGVDPIFVALTSRVNEIGRAIQNVAEARRAELQTQLAALVPAAPVARVAVVQVDTAERAAARAAAQTVFDSARAGLEQARLRLADQERRRRAIEAADDSAASPLALLAAALVIGAALGFASAFADELRRPRLADAAEAERVTGLRVLGIIQPRRTVSDRSRRASDRALPPYVDPHNDGHQLAYLHLATASQGLLVATVTGDEPQVSAIVAVNLAAVSAEEARSTVVVDADVAACDVAAALHVHAEPGVVEIIDQQASWSEVTQAVPVGRSSSIDVIASGTAAPLPTWEELASLMETSAQRLTRHYDSVIVVAAEAHARKGLPAKLPMPLVVYCARIGHTRIHDLRASLADITAAGGQPVGLVIWDDAPPSLPTPEELASRSRRPQRTSEHRVPAGTA